MNKFVIVVASLLFLVSCSDKQKEIKPEVKKSPTIKKAPKIKKTPDVNKTKEVKKEIIKEFKAPIMVIPEEFIPEHVRNSTIEVVPH